MNTYMMKSPIYYAIFIQGFKDKNGWYLSNEEEIDEFARKFNMTWSWNMRKGVLSFKDKSEGVKRVKPEYVQIGDVVTAYDDWERGTCYAQVWTSKEFDKKFIKVDE